MNQIQPQNTLYNLFFVSNTQANLHYENYENTFNNTPYETLSLYQQDDMQIMSPINSLQFISEDQAPFLFLSDHLINPQENIYQNGYAYENMLEFYTNALSFEPTFINDRCLITSDMNCVQGNDWMIMLICKIHKMKKINNLICFLSFNYGKFKYYYGTF